MTYNWVFAASVCVYVKCSVALGQGRKFSYAYQEFISEAAARSAVVGGSGFDNSRQLGNREHDYFIYLRLKTTSLMAVLLKLT